MESNNIRMDIYRLHPFTLCPESNSRASSQAPHQCRRHQGQDSPDRGTRLTLDSLQEMRPTAIDRPIDADSRPRGGGSRSHPVCQNAMQHAQVLWYKEHSQEHSSLSLFTTVESQVTDTTPNIITCVFTLGPCGGYGHKLVACHACAH